MQTVGIAATFFVCNVGAVGQPCVGVGFAGWVRRQKAESERALKQQELKLREADTAFQAWGSICAGRS